MRKIFFVFLMFVIPMVAVAQVPAQIDRDNDPAADVVVEGTQDLEDAAVDDPEEVTEAMVSGHFWIAVFAGLVLALAFQLLLTGLATAMGLSAFEIKREHPPHQGHRVHGDESPRAVYATSESGGRTEFRRPDGRPITNRDTLDEDERDESEDEGFHPTVRKYTSAFGLYWLITTPICAFFAAWLATELAVTSMAMTGIILGLTIWGLFFVTLALFEATAGTALFGSAIGLAVGSVKTAYEGITSMFSKSEADRAGDIAERVTKEVRDEIMGEIDTGKIADAIQGYVSQLRGPEPSEIRKELEKLLDKTELRAIIDDDRFLDHEEITAKLGIGENYQAKQRSQTVVNRIKNVISSMRSGDGGNGGRDQVDRVTDAMLQAAGVSARDAEQARQKVVDFLRSTNKAALNPEGIKRDIAKLFESPKEGMSALGARLSRIDRDTIADVVAQRTDMSREEARQKTDMVYGVIENLTGEFRRQSGGRGTTGVTEAVKSRLPDMERISQSAKDKIAMAVKNYLDQLDRPELNYEGVRRDFLKLFNDPSAGAKSLYHRLKRMDRDSIKAVVASIKGLDEHDAEKMIGTIENARDEVMAKAERFKDEVERRVEQAKDEAYHQADELRKDASTAAWWMVATAVLAGITAAIGGWMGAGM